MAKHLHDELAHTARVTVNTRYGPITGGKAENGSLNFLEIPYALPPVRFEDPLPLPEGYRYDNKEYVQETAYATQPLNDGQAEGTTFEDKVGFGKPTENPLFLNIAIPPSFPDQKNFPVKVYIHGGFLQFGSPHSLGSQAQYIAAERQEVWVNIGYRLSAFGFIASESAKLTGNYGFKDQWVALEWIRSNIESFGGNPNDIQITGLSAGAHSVHELLHHASILPEGAMAPFQSAIMQSNAILVDSKTQSELQPQFEALCRALNLDPHAKDILTVLKDPEQVSWESITKIIETDVIGKFGTFRGCLADDFLCVSPGLMERQKSGALARGLEQHGVKCVALGDLTEEWYLYSIANPIHGPGDILENLERCFPRDVATRLLDGFPKLPDNASAEESARHFGEVLSCGQVHLPVRVFAQDMQANGFPVLRYEIRWTPEQYRPFGYVTHGGDRLLWAFRTVSLLPDQIAAAKAWIDEVDKYMKAMTLDRTAPLRNVRQMLTLREDKTIVWTDDANWDNLMSLYDKVKDIRRAVL